VEGCLYGLQFWLELKCGTIPAKAETKISIKVETSQVEFAEARLRAGGTSGFLVKVTGSGRSAVCLLHGKYGGQLQAGLTERGLRELSYKVGGKPHEIIEAATRLSSVIT
jgi:hypothetical protein